MVVPLQILPISQHPIYLVISEPVDIGLGQNHDVDNEVIRSYNGNGEVFKMSHNIIITKSVQMKSKSRNCCWEWSAYGIWLFCFCDWGNKWEVYLNVLEWRTCTFCDLWVPFICVIFWRLFWQWKNQYCDSCSILSMKNCGNLYYKKFNRFANQCLHSTEPRFKSKCKMPTTKLIW